MPGRGVRAIVAVQRTHGIAVADPDRAAGQPGYAPMLDGQRLATELSS